MVAVRLIVCLAIVAPVLSEVYHSMSSGLYNYGGYYGMNDYDMYDYSRDNYMDAVDSQYQMSMLNNAYGLLGYNSYPMAQQYSQHYQGSNAVGNTVNTAPMSQAATHGGNHHAATVADIIRSILAGQTDQSNAVRQYVVV